MPRSSAMVRLVLVGSTLLVAGCRRAAPDPLRKDEEQQQTSTGRVGGVGLGPRIIGGSAGAAHSGTSSAAAPSARGGFGGSAAGHASAST